jgi:hypothetical protein
LPNRFCYRHGVRTAGIVVAVLLSASIARADRHTVMTIGGTFVATSYANTTQNDPSMNGGARISMSFEDAPLGIPGVGLFDHDARLVPELFAGFYTDDTRARSQVGAGLRAEWQLARGPMPGVSYSMRMAIYFAARAKISGPDAKPGAEFVIGEYILSAHDCRFGWEGGLGMIKRPDLDGSQSPELEALVNVYIGWDTSRR